MASTSPLSAAAPSLVPTAAQAPSKSLGIITINGVSFQVTVSPSIALDPKLQDARIQEVVMNSIQLLADAVVKSNPTAERIDLTDSGIVVYNHGIANPITPYSKTNTIQDTEFNGLKDKITALDSRLAKKLTTHSTAAVSRVLFGILSPRFALPAAAPTSSCPRPRLAHSPARSAAHSSGVDDESSSDSESASSHSRRSSKRSSKPPARPRALASPAASTHDSSSLSSFEEEDEAFSPDATKVPALANPATPLQARCPLAIPPTTSRRSILPDTSASSRSTPPAVPGAFQPPLGSSGKPATASVKPSSAATGHGSSVAALATRAPLIDPRTAIDDDFSDDEDEKGDAMTLPAQGAVTSHQAGSLSRPVAMGAPQSSASRASAPTRAPHLGQRANILAALLANGTR